MISFFFSLRMVDTLVSQTFTALGVCPVSCLQIERVNNHNFQEDVWIRYEVAKMIVEVDSDVVANGNITIMSMRRTIKVGLRL